jgi:hypothetical protein
MWCFIRIYLIFSTRNWFNTIRRMKLIKKTIPKLYAFKKGYSVTDKLSLNEVSDVLFF